MAFRSVVRLQMQYLAQPIASSSSRLSHRAFASTLAQQATSSTSSSSSNSTPKPKAVKRPISSCTPGTTLTGLAILKDQADPVALPDEEYPAWLWTILDQEKASSSTSTQARPQEGSVDFAAERKRLRAQNKANIKAANYLKTT